MVYSLVVKANGLEYGVVGSSPLHVKPETKLLEERVFLVVERVLRPCRWPTHC